MKLEVCLIGWRPWAADVLLSLVPP